MDDKRIDELMTLAKINVEAAKQMSEEVHHSRLLNLCLVGTILAIIIGVLVCFSYNEQKWRDYIGQYDYVSESYEASTDEGGMAIINGEGSVSIGAGEKDSKEANAQG